LLQAIVRNGVGQGVLGGGRSVLATQKPSGWLRWRRCSVTNSARLGHGRRSRWRGGA
jgi:hypothetical protein